MDLLDLVGLATVCDVVPLQRPQPRLRGARPHVMRQRRNIGLKALADAAGLAVPPTPYHLGFVLGPRINAGGRIGDSGLGARLLAPTTRPRRRASPCCSTSSTASARRSRRRCSRRRCAGRLLAGGAIPSAAADASPPRAGTRAWSGWSPAGWWTASICPPASSPGTSKAEGTGSLRSIAGVDIGGAVRAAVAAGHLVKGGGHAMAAGLSVARDRLDALDAFLRERLAVTTGAARTAARSTSTAR